MQIKKPDPVLGEWLHGFEDFDGASDMIILEEDAKKKRKKKKKEMPILDCQSSNILRKDSKDSPRNRKRKKPRSHDDRTNLVTSRRQRSMLKNFIDFLFTLVFNFS